MGEVKESLALENGGEMTLADAMIAIILTSACPTRSSRKKHEKMRDVHYKEVTSSDRQPVSWMRRARRRMSRKL